MHKNPTFFLIMCGGRGQRLWPISGGLPKQFLALPSGRTMIEETIDRIKVLNGKIGLILGREHLEEAKKRVGDFIDFYSVEPSSKNTAAAIGLACLRLSTLGQENSVVVFMPCDHRVDSQQAFNEAILRAIKLAEKNNLVLIGCRPQKADSGLGYVSGCHDGRVECFVEKPAIEKAKILLETGFLINSGIFVGRVSTFLNHFQKLCPSLLFELEIFLKTGKGFQNLPNISFDKAIIQAGADCFLIKSQFQFLDLGTVETFLSLKNLD